MNRLDWYEFCDHQLPETEVGPADFAFQGERHHDVPVIESPQLEHQIPFCGLGTRFAIVHLPDDYDRQWREEIRPVVCVVYPKRKRMNVNYIHVHSSPDEICYLLKGIYLFSRDLIPPLWIPDFKAIICANE